MLNTISYSVHKKTNMKKYLKSCSIFFRLINESLLFAYASIIANKLRTFLSLLGITIGIFAIITMFTVIDALEKNISNSLSAIGQDVIYIDPFPWGPPEGETEYKWWKYLQRPINKYDEFIHISQTAQTVGATGFGVWFSREAKYKSNVASSSGIYGATHEFDQILQLDIEEGRYFSLAESQRGSSVALLGAMVASELFKDESPIDKDIKIGGRKLKVIGVLKKKGESMININNFDNIVVIPFQLARSMVDLRRSRPDFAVKAKPGVSVAAMADDLRMQLRAYRRLKPIQEDNFALNQLSIIEDLSKKIFGAVNMVGWVIGAFSLLVGGFGIANIMFVSVRERTNIIGIQKALGAKNYFILIQFLAEAVLLSIVGGMIGLFLIFLITLAINAATSFSMVLSLENIELGLLISSVIGIISGFIPAFMASRLDPVVAISSK